MGKKKLSYDGLEKEREKKRENKVRKKESKKILAFRI